MAEGPSGSYPTEYVYAITYNLDGGANPVARRHLHLRSGSGASHTDADRLHVRRLVRERGTHRLAGHRHLGHRPG